MAEEIGFENGRNSNFQGLVTLTLDPAIRHTVDLYLYTKFHSNQRNFLWTDGRTDIFTPLILLGRLLEVDLTRKVGPVDNFCVSDKVMAAYPEDHTLGTHVEDLV